MMMVVVQSRFVVLGRSPSQAPDILSEDHDATFLRTEGTAHVTSMAELWDGRLAVLLSDRQVRVLELRQRQLVGQLHSWRRMRGDGGGGGDPSGVTEASGITEDANGEGKREGEREAGSEDPQAKVGRRSDDGGGGDDDDDEDTPDRAEGMRVCRMVLALLFLGFAGLSCSPSLTLQTPLLERRNEEGWIEPQQR